ncbi:MAG TPA: cation diffusion facilitator family transporter [Dongiaceae bacterium]|jgi:ferrous-iron efflux pump FieF|nr:cation diffusion facilitator family transporter [Dongiaceae bacterium]
MAIDPKSAGLMRQAGVASVAAALALIAIKLYAFIETGSVSMLSTLFDSALDFGASLVNLLAIRTAVMPADAEHRFGHGKAEPLAGLVQVGFILGSSILLLVEVVDHFLHPQAVQHATLGIVVMVVSIAITGVLILFQRSVVKRTGSLAVTADAAHYGSDFVVNISVIAALILSSLLGWWWIDPLCGLLVAALIAFTAISIGRQALDMLMDREMDDADRDRIADIVRSHPEVVDLHDLRTRVSGQDRFIQLHLELSPDILLKAAHRISDEVEARLMQAFPGAEVIIHQDPYGIEERRARFR